MRLELTFDVVPDELGVIDGRKLAQALISAAYQNVVPYVRGCPACADNLFSGIANQAIEELHVEGRKIGTLPGGLYRFGEVEDATERHIEAAKETTRALLEKAGEAHSH